MRKHGLQIAFIGAGSIGFTRGLLADILTVPEFKDIEISFTDINGDGRSTGKGEFDEIVIDGIRIK